MMVLEKVDSFKHMAMVGIYVRFLGCISFEPISKHEKSTSWWMLMVEPPIWKICSSNWIISPRGGWKKTYLKPPSQSFSPYTFPSEDSCQNNQSSNHSRSPSRVPHLLRRFFHVACRPRCLFSKYSCSAPLGCLLRPLHALSQQHNLLFGDGNHGR